MNGLMSVASSSEPRSIISDPTSSESSTDTSTSTEVGIGSLGGRALYAFGEATLRGFENLAIHRKLRSIGTLFPHEDTDTNKDIDKIYDDVLELSRPGLYRLQVRKQVLKLLLVQIGTRHTRYLVRHLIKWPPVEMALFLAELMACMPPAWLPPETRRTGMHRELTSTYLACQTVTGYRREYHTASPLVDFIVALSRIDYSACQSVLNAGFLDMLLCMYTCNFSGNITSNHDITDARGKSKIVEACTAALLQLCESPRASAVVSAHPVCAVWPQNQLLIAHLGHRVESRHLTWRKLGPLIVARRLASLPDILKLPTPKNSTPDNPLIEACADLVGFASNEMVYGSEITEGALKCIHICVELRGPHWTALSNCLNDAHPADSQNICRRLMLRGSPTRVLFEKLLYESIQPRNLNHPAHPVGKKHPGDRTRLLSRAIPSEVLPPEDTNQNTNDNPLDDGQWPMNVEENRHCVFWVDENKRVHDHVYGAAEPCLDGTRTILLLRVKMWIEKINVDSPRIFWLQGMAGEGKSAIASSVSRWFDDTRRFTGACFVFSPNDSRRRDTTFLFSTIAIQLARRHHNIDKFVSKAMDRYTKTSSASDEFNLLLKQPLEAAARESSFTASIVIVLDEIDSLWDEEPVRRDIFRALMLLDQLPPFVKIFITSRPQHDLQTLFNLVCSRVENYRLGEAPIDIFNRGIVKLIKARMATLVDKREALHDTKGTFHWASAAMNYIEYSNGDATKATSPSIHRINSSIPDESSASGSYMDTASFFSAYSGDTPS